MCCRYEIYEAPDGKFGTMSEDMEWDGMIKELIEKVSVGGGGKG